MGQRLQARHRNDREFCQWLIGSGLVFKIVERSFIPETNNLGADTLRPDDTCLSSRHDAALGHDYGYTQLFKFRDTYLPSIVDRFHPRISHINLTNSEVYSVQELCGFEIVVRGSSPWCEVFTRKDWLNFECAHDMIHYYRAGPGNSYAPTMGWLWLDAAANPSKGGPLAEGAFFSL